MEEVDSGNSVMATTTSGEHRGPLHQDVNHEAISNNTATAYSDLLGEMASSLDEAQKQVLKLTLDMSGAFDDSKDDIATEQPARALPRATPPQQARTVRADSDVSPRAGSLNPRSVSFHPPPSVRQLATSQHQRSDSGPAFSISKHAQLPQLGPPVQPPQVRNPGYDVENMVRQNILRSAAVSYAGTSQAPMMPYLGPAQPPTRPSATTYHWPGVPHAFKRDYSHPTPPISLPDRSNPSEGRRAQRSPLGDIPPNIAMGRLPSQTAGNLRSEDDANDRSRSPKTSPVVVMGHRNDRSEIPMSSRGSHTPQGERRPTASADESQATSLPKTQSIALDKSRPATKTQAANENAGGMPDSKASSSPQLIVTPKCLKQLSQPSENHTRAEKHLEVTSVTSPALSKADTPTKSPPPSASTIDREAEIDERSAVLLERGRSLARATERLRLQLYQEVEAKDTLVAECSDLQTRVDDLTAENRSLKLQLDHTTSENDARGSTISAPDMSPERSIAERGQDEAVSGQDHVMPNEDAVEDCRKYLAAGLVLAMQGMKKTQDEDNQLAQQLRKVLAEVKTFMPSLTGRDLLISGLALLWRGARLMAPDQVRRQSELQTLLIEAEGILHKPCWQEGTLRAIKAEIGTEGRSTSVTPTEKSMASGEASTSQASAPQVHAAKETHRPRPQPERLTTKPKAYQKARHQCSDSEPTIDDNVRDCIEMARLIMLFRALKLT